MHHALQAGKPEPVQEKQLARMMVLFTRKLTYIQQTVDNVTDTRQNVWLCLP